MKANKLNSGRDYAVIAFLMLTLLSSVGVTVARVKGNATTPVVQTTKPQVSVTRLVEPAEIIVPNWTPEQNPFTKPVALRVPENETEPKLSTAHYGGNEPKFSSRRWSNVLPVLPASIYGCVGASKMGLQPNMASSTPALPEAVLMAMIKGPNGRIGVIKFGGSPAQTVGEGDSLADGFKVKCFGEDYAVLTNGRNEIIAKRLRT